MYDDRHSLDALSELAILEMDRTGWNRMAKLNGQRHGRGPAFDRGAMVEKDAVAELCDGYSGSGYSSLKSYLLENLYGLTDAELEEVERKIELLDDED